MPPPRLTSWLNRKRRKWILMWFPINTVRQPDESRAPLYLPFTQLCLSPLERRITTRIPAPMPLFSYRTAAQGNAISPHSFQHSKSSELHNNFQSSRPIVSREWANLIRWFNLPFFVLLPDNLCYSGQDEIHIRTGDSDYFETYPGEQHLKTF